MNAVNVNTERSPGNACKLFLPLAQRIPEESPRRSAFLALCEWASIAARLAPAESSDPERVATRGLLRALTAYALYANRDNLEPVLWRTCETYAAVVRSFA